MYVKVIVDISHSSLDRPFEYKIPEGMEKIVNVGSVVNVPFGKGNKLIKAYVIEISDKSEYDPGKIKELTGIDNNSMPVESELISLAWFIKENYGSTMSKALKTVLTVGKKVKKTEKKYLLLNVSEEEGWNYIQTYRQKKTTGKRADFLEYLLKKKRVSESDAKKDTGISDSIIKALKTERIIDIEKEVVYRSPFNKEDIEDTPTYSIELTPEQRRVSDDILNDNNKPHLIFGVTGSGKTEVYMDMIDRFLKEGKEAIVLLPEIALTYQMIKRYYRRFGDVVSIINSRMSDGEKFDQFERAKKGDVKIMVGPRSALFTPFTNLGIIIMDEEHDGAYKSDKVPKYHTRDVAIKRAEISGAYMVMGSATPAVDSYYKALNGVYILHKLLKRPGNSVLPDVETVDMREEIKSGNLSIFSEKLQKGIADRLKKNEQSLLFINRRGYSSFVSCRSCGHIIKCPHCEVSLTYHNDKKLRCHYCGYEKNVPEVCPECGSVHIGRFGIGTQQIEDKLKEMFPDIRVLRMDYDTTRKKGEYERIVESFEKKEADVLVGTQMIVKGYDFPDVTLVGVLAADLSLFDSDYMSGEKTFQLITQAAGRAGRGSKKGEVVLQTYNPDEPCLKAAVKQDYEMFYNGESAYRNIVKYPPFGELCVIFVGHEDEGISRYVINDISSRIDVSIRNGDVKDVVKLGPSKAGIYKVNDIYRNVIYIKSENPKMLGKLRKGIEKYIDILINNNKQFEKIIFQCDMNPYSVY